MRKRHNLAPRMEACAEYLIEDPAALRGRWREIFPDCEKLWVELGCGKGRFTVETALQTPDALLIAIEKVPDAMVLAMERARDMALPNVRFMDYDAAELAGAFAPGEIDRLFLNFSDPWPKSRDAKFRLTAPGFLRLYADALAPDGQIHFKTDNAPLFAWSAEQLTREGWALSEVTDDLHRDGPVGVMTDYEAKFHAEGIRIHRLVASKTTDTKGTAAGAVPRLRNAALSDARGRGQRDCSQLRLTEATLPLCHEFYRSFRSAPELYEDRSKCTPFHYDPAWVDAKFASRLQQPDRRDFSVLLGDEVIGELVIKHIDPEKRNCALGICLVNDHFKNHGYGTAAVLLALRCGFEELGMETILADSLLRNTRSQHVLKKAGFRFVSEDEHFRYYQITREQYESDREGESR